MPHETLFSFRRMPLLCIAALFLAAGCSSMSQGLTAMLEPVTAELVYTPPASPTSPTRKPAAPVYLHAVDDRRSLRLAQNADITNPVLNNVSLRIRRPEASPAQDTREANILPALAAQRALAARMGNIGYPAYIDAAHAGVETRELILYLYGFEVDFEAETACAATVALAVGKPAPLPGASTAPSVAERRRTHPGKPFVITPVPPGPTDTPVPADLLLLAPVCTQSVGLGTAPVVDEDASQAAGIALSRALQQAVDNLNVRECLR